MCIQFKTNVSLLKFLLSSYFSESIFKHFFFPITSFEISNFTLSHISTVSQYQVYHLIKHFYKHQLLSSKPTILKYCVYLNTKSIMFNVVKSFTFVRTFLNNCGVGQAWIQLEDNLDVDTENFIQVCMSLHAFWISSAEGQVWL